MRIQHKEGSWRQPQDFSGATVRLEHIETVWLIGVQARLFPCHEVDLAAIGHKQGALYEYQFFALRELEIVALDQRFSAATRESERAYIDSLYRWRQCLRSMPLMYKIDYILAGVRVIVDATYKEIARLLFDARLEYILARVQNLTRLASIIKVEPQEVFLRGYLLC